MSRSPRHNKNEQLEFDDPSIEPDEEEWEDEDWDDDEYESEDDEYESSVPTENYFTSSLAPIHILLFVLPLILIWEVGVGMYLTDPSTGDVLLIRAGSGCKGSLKHLVQLANVSQRSPLSQC